MGEIIMFQRQQHFRDLTLMMMVLDYHEFFLQFM